MAYKLVRMQVPMACSLQLASHAVLIESHTGHQGTPPLDHERRPSQHRSAQRPFPAPTLYLLFEALMLLRGLSKFAANATGQLGNAVVHYCAELITSLEDSAVLEHAARVLLLLAEAGVPLSKDTESIMTSNCWQLCSIYLNLRCALGRLVKDPATAPLAARLRVLLRGRCLQHAVLSMGLTALAAADDGPVHNLPPALVAGLPVLTATTGGACGGSSGEGGSGGGGGGSDAGGVTYVWPNSVLLVLSVVSPTTLESGAEWRVRTPCRPAPPPGRKAALQLAMRVGRLAVTSAQAAAASAPPPPPPAGAAGGVRQPTQRAARGGGGQRRYALAPADCALTAVAALRAAWQLLPLPPPQGPPPSQAGHGSSTHAAAAADWWRLAAAVVAHVGRLAAAAELASLAEMLVVFPSAKQAAFEERDGVFLLPPSPPPSLAAALEGGLLACLERLMRRMGTDVGGPAMIILAGVLAPEALAWGYFAPLLGHGQPAQVGALVVTVGKLLRRLEAAAWGPLSPGSGGLGAAAAVAAAYERLGTTALRVVFALMPPGRAYGPTPGVSGQVGAALALAATEWLPPLSRMLQRVTARKLAAAEAQGQKAAAVTEEDMEQGVHLAESPVIFRLSIICLLGWLESLAARAYGGDAPPAAPAGGQPVDRGSGDGDACGGGGGGAASWRAVLLVELGGVELLGGLLRLPPADVQDVGATLATACCALAAACPAELRGAAEEPVRCDGAGPTPAMAAAGTAAGGGGGVAGGHAKAWSTWPVARLRQLAAALAAEGAFFDELVDGMMELAARLQLDGGAGGGGGGSSGEHSFAALLRRDVDSGPASLLAGSPAEARRLLRACCANPRCASLDGDSEAGLRLQACGGCGAVGYCCRECQTAHWRAGHKAACAGKRSAGPSAC